MGAVVRVVCCGAVLCVVAQWGRSGRAICAGSRRGWDGRATDETCGDGLRAQSNGLVTALGSAEHVGARSNKSAGSAACMRARWS